MTLKRLFILSVILFFTENIMAQLPLSSPAENQRLLNDPVDISADFYNFS